MRRRWIGLVVVLGLAWGGLAATLLSGILPKLGLDLQGGTSVVLTAPPGTPQDTLEFAVEIMRRRIEDFGGVQEPEISISGANTVLIQLPGVDDPERALQAIGQTGQLSFRPILDESFSPESPLVTTTTTSSTTSTTAPAVTTTTTEGSATSTTAEATTTSGPATGTSAGSTTTTTFPAGVDPDSGLTVTDDPSREAFLPERGPDGSVIDVYKVGPAALIGSDIADAIPFFDTFNAQWIVQLDLTPQGADKFAELTKQAAQYPGGFFADPRRKIGIVLDGEVITAPPVADEVDPTTGITGGRAVITIGGSGTAAEQEARDLAVVLRYGALPVSFDRSQVQTVSATLGADSLRTGLVAGIGGLVAVAVLLLSYYRAMGIVAVLGLAVFGSFLISIFGLLGRLQGLTLTLAGVTGLILSIGITADSYVVYFERVKDELRSGRTVRSAVEEGFKGAFRTIVTADTVSLLAAGLLWWLAVGPVKGFALSLAIATILDLIVARAFTRRATAVLAHTPLASRGRFSIKAVTGARA